MASKARDYAKAAENMALLGAQLGGYALPIAPAVGLASALRPATSDPDAEAFVSRFLDEIERWCDAHRSEIDRIGGMPSNWRDYLVDKMGARAPSDPAAAHRLLLEGLFVPLTATSRSSCEELVRNLASDIPELIVRAGDPYGAFGALRALNHSDVSRIEGMIAALDPSRRDDADPALLAAYLRKLVENLSLDYWVAREGGVRANLPAIRQRLILTSTKRGPAYESVPVEGLVDRCERLVVLGGPGAGKSWTARGAVIGAAEAALAQLAAGAQVQAVEIPLFATCSQVLEFGELPRWERLINATLSWALTDPGQATRLAELLRTHRLALIVLDGLDEAANPEVNALHEFLGARGPDDTRLIVTSRSGSWDDGWIELEEGNDRHEVGVLEPFDDEAIHYAVAAWLDDIPAVRDRLLNYLGTHPSLHQQVRVPLLCAMLCLVARPDSAVGDDPFDTFEPGHTLDLFDTAIHRLLSAPWRGRTVRPSNAQIEAAVRWLEDLAEAGALTDPVTGLGKWPDGVEPGEDPPPGTNTHVEHVAPPDPYRPGGRQTCRFLHRSIREHLVARALGRRDPVELATKLLPHVWFDADWAEVIPAVVARHPAAERVTAELLRLVGEVIPNDPTHALDDILIKAAALTHPSENAPIRTRAIETALGRVLERPELDSWTILLARAIHWPAIDHVRERLVDQLHVDNTDASRLAQLATALAQLHPTHAQAKRAGDRLLDLLDGEVRVLRGTADRLPEATLWATVILVEAVSRLDLTEEQMLRARSAIVSILTVVPPQATDRSLHRAGPDRLAACLVRLKPALSELRSARATLLTLGKGFDRPDVGRVVAALMQLEPMESERARITSGLVRAIQHSAGSKTVASLAESLLLVHPSEAHMREARKAILTVLGMGTRGGRSAARLARVLVKLDPDPVELGEARQALITMLQRTSGQSAARIASGLLRLGPSAEEIRSARETVMRLLAKQDALGINDLHPDLGHREWLVNAIASHTAYRSRGRAAADLVAALVLLRPSLDELRRASRVVLANLELLNDLAGRTDGQVAARLALRLSQLNPDPDEMARARRAILRHLASDPTTRTAKRFACGLADLQPSSEEKRVARMAIVRHLSSAPARGTAYDLMSALTRLSPAEDVLSGLERWDVPPTPALLRSVRGHCSPTRWYRVVASLPSM